MQEQTVQHLSDEQLIRSLALGESPAIRTIYQQCYPTIEKMVYRLHGSFEDAYDIFQDTMTILYEKAKDDDFKLSCRLSTYLTAIAKKLWLKKLERKKNQSITLLHDAHENVEGVEEDVNRFQEFEKHIHLLDHSLQTLGEPCATLLRAFYKLNLSMQAIASQYGYTNAENAKTQKYKCLNRLRKIFFSESNRKMQHEGAH